MQIPSKYEPTAIENKWYAYWLEHKIFVSEPDERVPYTIVIPPPNVTGVLHMGHMLNNTIQDILVRRARMLGKNACWLPGTDHASIATEAKVVGKLKAEGIDKNTLTRDEFLAHAWEWKEKHGGIILEQLKKLGASCDWTRTKFTMDDDMSESVTRVFVDLYNKGLIYRGVRMVNWDPKALTAVSDEEVIYKEVQSKFYYLKYFLQGSNDYITIATTRPETILGDTAICVHPDDERYQKYIGKKVLVPLINRAIKIIADPYVEMDFGTGALKVTPAHDINDYNLGIKHKLDSIDIFNDDGSLNDNAQLFVGCDRFEARKRIVNDLENHGHLIKTENIVNKIGFSERTDEVIEPKLSTQWFCKMSEMAKPALDVVMKDTVRFHPKKFKNTYRHWMENIRDWCISRQLWWGHRIPAYYLPNGQFVVASNHQEALNKARELMPDIQNHELKQDEDVLDTWFSSWLWPISVFDGIRNPNNKDIKYYYPTNDLVTAPEILFFWVARMIMAGLEFHGEVPFKNVYLTGIVRDKLGRKMSKSLGNSPDPLELMKVYGADGVRTGMLFCSAAGNDLLYEDSLCEQGRNFSNKIWNALRLVKGWQIDENAPQPEVAQKAAQWFEASLNKNLQAINEQFEQYRLSEALMMVYKLIRDDYCSWYLEMIKPPYQKPVDLKTYKEALGFMEHLMRILHPFMPFITEEVWHIINPTEGKKSYDSLAIAAWPENNKWASQIIYDFEFVKDIIAEIRNLRFAKNIPQKQALKLYVKKNFEETPDTFFDAIIMKLCHLDSIEYVNEKVVDTLGFVIKKTEFYIPVADKIDVQETLQKLNEELNYTKGFLKTVMKKLNNEKFVANAPEKVVQIEQRKKADAEARIEVLEEQINSMTKASDK